MIRKMDRENRAKQFMPFSALKGYDVALRQEEQIIIPQIEFSDEYMEELGRKLQQLQPGEKITVEYYWNGVYKKIWGTVNKIDTIYRYLWIDDKKIGFDSLKMLSKSWEEC